jgi:hypothetical protein
MPLDKDMVLAEIDAALARYEEVESNYRHYAQSSFAEAEHWISAPHEVDAEIITLLRGTIDRFAPPGGSFGSMMLKEAEKSFSSPDRVIKQLAGVLVALRRAYAADQLQMVRSMIHMDLLSDFLSMAEYLIVHEKLKDPAAVLAGSVLEDHLRKLCQKHSIDATVKDNNGNDVPKKLTVMNADLAKAGAYNLNDQKQVEAWAGIRNSAAHGKFGEYQMGQVDLMVQGIRGFIGKNSA